MRQFYKFALSAITAMLVSYSASAQCPAFDITAGATEVSGSDFVCDGTNVTVQWNDVPGATGYRLRVGNNASYDNLDVSYVVDGGGAGPFQSTFAVPAATNGTFYTYTVDYSMDGGFSLGTAAGAVYTDCSVNAATFKVSIDPTPVTTFSITDGTDGVANTYCANSTIEITADGTVGDLGQYYWTNDGGVTWNAAGTNSVFTIDATVANGFNTAGVVNIDVATADLTCSVNDPVASQGAGPLATTLRDIYDITAVTTTDDGAITNGQVVCFDGSGTDVFSISYTDILGTGTNGTINTSTDSGASFSAGAAAASPQLVTIAAEDVDHAFFISDGAYCQNSVDTFFTSTYDNASAAPGVTDLSYSVDGGASFTAISGPFTICEGQALIIKFDKTVFAGDLGDNGNTTVSWDYDDIGNNNYSEGGDLTGQNSALLSSGNEFSYTIPALTAPQQINSRVRITDACTGGVILGTSITVNTKVSSDAGTSSALTVTREDNATLLTSGGKVCSGELLDLSAVIGDGAVGTGGELRIYKITATDTTLLANGASPQTVTDHDHGTVAATYHAVIVSECDSISVASTPQITANVFITSGNLTSFSFLDTASLADNIACDSEALILQTTPSTIGDDAATVNFYTNTVSGTIDGNEVLIGAGGLSGGVYSIPTNHINVDVWYIAELTSECNAGSVFASNMISTHATPTGADDPTIFDISEVAAGNTDLGDDVVNASALVCAGSTVYWQLADGDVDSYDDGSFFEWSVDSGSGWSVLDTTYSNLSSVSVLVNQNTSVRVQIKGGQCGYTGAVLTSTVNVKAVSQSISVVELRAQDDVAGVGVGGNPSYILDFNAGTKVGVDSICSFEDLLFELSAFNNVGATDNPRIDGLVDGVYVGTVPVASDESAGNFVVYYSGPLTPGSEYSLEYIRDCSDTVLLGSFTVTYLDDNVQDANLDARLADAGNNGTAVVDNQPVCPGTEVTFYNDGTLGEAKAGRTAAEYVFVYNDGSGPVTVNNGTDSTLTLTINSTTTVESYITGGCNPAVAPTSATFTVNVISSQNNFTSISLNQDNYCADEAANLLVSMTANGAALNFDDTTKVVWYSMDDAGNPVTKIQSIKAGTPGAGSLHFNQGAIGDAPDTTTTIGVRLEGCDTTGFEVRTITVKDLPQNQSAAGAPSVVSASPSSVCSGSSSTLSIINYITGTNGQVTWYDDAVATNLLATGPSFTPSNITSDTTFYVRIEADCDTTAMLSVTVTLSTIDPTDVLSISVPAYICEGGSFVAEAIGSVGDGSYIWEVSFDGVVFSSISDGSPGDKFLSYSANNLNYTGNTANVTLRASRTNGCITTDPSPSETSFEVRQNPDRLTSMQSTDTEVCVNEAPVDFVVSGGNAGYDGQIQWNIVKTGGADSVVTQWANMSTVSFDWANFDGSGEYTLYAQYVSGSCGTYAEDSVSSVINIYELPTNDYPNASNDTIVCSNDTLDLNGLSGYANYSFSGPGVIAGNLYVASQGSFANSEVGGVESLTYTVTENGCTSVFTVEVVVNGTAKITAATTTDASCNATDGTAKVTVISGGSAPFDFSTDAMSFGFAADSTITGLAGGAHNLYVRDANGCISSAFGVTVASSTGFSVVGNVESEITCNGDEDGEFSVAVTGGLAPYDYTVTLDGNPFASGTDVTSNSYSFANLAPGAYVATFVDDAGCSLSYSYTFVEPSEIGLTVTDFQEVDCFGEATGVIGGLVATSTHGGPFEYKLNDGDFETVTGFSGLVAGDYLITVRDTNLCERTFLFSINEPTALEIDTNVVDFDENGYDIELDANGGTPSYTYSKGGSFQTSNLFEDIAPGTHTFTVKDANGCETDITVFLAPVGIKENVGIFAGAVANPNPFSNEFTISGITQGVEITITDVYGKRVDFVSVIKDSKATITTGNLATGVYFTTVRKGNSVATFRMLKD